MSTFSTRNSAIWLLTLLLGLAWSAHGINLEPETAWTSATHFPARIAVDPATHLLYVTSPATGSILVLNRDGAAVDSLSGIPHPTAITADGAGHLFVVDGNVVRRLTTAGVEKVLMRLRG